MEREWLIVISEYIPMCWQLKVQLETGRNGGKLIRINRAKFKNKINNIKDIVREPYKS